MAAALGKQWHLIDFTLNKTLLNASSYNNKTLLHIIAVSDNSSIHTIQYFNDCLKHLKSLVNYQYISFLHFNNIQI